MNEKSRHRILVASIVALTVIIVSPLGAVTPEEFAGVVNAGVSLQDLATIVAQQRFEEIDIDRYFILEGSVASTQVYNPDPAAFEAVIELVDSRWVELNRIERYSVYILVTDPGFAARLPERLPRDPGPEIIRTNQRLLVIGPYIGATPNLTDPSDALYPVVQAIVIR